MLELLLELRLLLLLFLLVAANEVETANAQAMKALSAGTINLFMMLTTPSNLNNGWRSLSLMHNAVKLTRHARLTRPTAKARPHRRMLVTTHAVEQVICNQSLPCASRWSGCRAFCRNKLARRVDQHFFGRARLLASYSVGSHLQLSAVRFLEFADESFDRADGRSILLT